MVVGAGRGRGSDAEFSEQGFRTSCADLDDGLPDETIEFQTAARGAQLQGRREGYAYGDRGLALRINGSMVCEMLRVGLPISITTLAELGVYMGSTLFVAGFGPEATAAHALTLRLAGVAYALIAGLSQASTVRMARSLNEGGKGLQKETIRASGIIALGSGIFLPAILILAAFISPTVLPAAGLSHEATENAFWLLIVLAATEIIEPMGCAATGLLQGCSDTKVPMYYSLAGNWAVGVRPGLSCPEYLGLALSGCGSGFFWGCRRLPFRPSSVSAVTSDTEVSEELRLKWVRAASLGRKAPQPAVTS